LSVRPGGATSRKWRRLGEQAESALREALAGKPSHEVRRSIEDLLPLLTEQSPEQLRFLRAVEVLEKAATPEAREALADLARGGPQARLTREARCPLDRLSASIGRRR
jgi:hypothetical protein